MDPSQYSKSDFPYHVEIQTRWHDNDIYGHVNNVIYYSYFDTAVNHYLVKEAALDIHRAKEIAFVVSSSCDYFEPIAYPGLIDVGIRVKKLGNSSIAYEIGIFVKTGESIKAFGEFLHVFVNRENKQSVKIPLEIRKKLEEIVPHS